MANLVSPGVAVSIIDESQYLPGASSSVPLILVASAQNKLNGAGTGVASATTAANANKLQLLTSQRDLTNLFGSPFFYKTTTGTPIHGYELNEYGLLAAYSVLGVSNRAYVLRADVDMGALVGKLARPVGEPTDGTYWLDTTNSTWGIYEFNATTGKYTNKLPIVITEASQMVDGFPKDSIGSIGSYAVIPMNITTGPGTAGTYFYKNRENTWVELGSKEWKQSVPTVTSGTGTVQPGQFTITTTNGTYTITVGSNDTLTDIANSINGVNDSYLTASVYSGVLNVFYAAPGKNRAITFTDGVGTPLAHIGGFNSGSSAVSPDVSVGTSANMPLWSASQQYPHPTGSVWVKTSSAGLGINTLLSKYATSTAKYTEVKTSLFTTLKTANALLDSTGGKNITAGSVVGTYSGFDGIGDTEGAVQYASTGIIWYKRKATGATTITGVNTNVSFVSDKSIQVATTTPGASTVTNAYTVPCVGNAEEFVQAWQAQNIPNTTASVSSTGAIVLTHTLGGELYLTDMVDGQSSGALEELGFVNGVNALPTAIQHYTNADVTYTTQTGASATISVSNNGSYYDVAVTSGGTNFAFGDSITITGNQLGGVSGTNDLVLTVTSVNGSGSIQTVAIASGTPRVNFFTQLSNWELLNYVANEGSPASLPANGTPWYYSTASQVDLMVNVGGQWVGYGNAGYDNTGFPGHSINNATDAGGVIVSATTPLTQTDGTSLVPGDIWLDSGDLENYPALSRWEIIDEVAQWVAVDNKDQTSAKGILFADARWAVSGSVDPVSDPMSTISELRTSDYLDLDAPDATLYPTGMILFNTRRSGYNVKKFTKNYFTQAKFPNTSLPTYSYTWVSASGLKADGSAYMGRKAQRAMIVQSLKAAIGTNMQIREEDTFFNLIVCPGYPELQPDMVGLNNERNNTAYIIGDTPLRLNDQATDLTAWATNAAGATATGEEGLVSRDQYLGIFYPSGITSDLTGAAAVVPASHMMLRTFIRNDTIAYPWLAAAGTRRGNIDNATNIGYIDATTGEFQTVKNRMGIRDVLYSNQINPLAFFTGVGLLNYGNKNAQDTQSAMDRTNVARLVAYIRERLQVAARPFVFEPNDSLTRGQLTAVVQSLFVDLVAKRGLYDYLVVCDETNNTPARIDRNELWIDVAIEPVKAAEFIYIPVRIMNTGEIAGLK